MWKRRKRTVIFRARVRLDGARSERAKSIRSREKHISEGTPPILTPMQPIAISLLFFVDSCMRVFACLGRAGMKKRGGGRLKGKSRRRHAD